MELRQLMRIVLRWWWLIALPVAVVTALTLPALLLASPVTTPALFTTNFRYTAAQQPDALPREGDYQDIWLASELTVNALTDWVLSGSFRAALVAEAEAQGVTVEPAALGLAGDNDRSVGQIFLSYTDPDTLAVLADAAATVLQTRNQDIFPQLGGEPAEVTILDTPQIVAAPPPLTDRFEPVLRVGLSVMVGFGLALLAHYLDPMLRRREDVESLGVNVLVSIPRK